MDFKFLEIGTRIAIGQFDTTIIEYDVLDGFSGLFPVYVARFDTGETEPIHHTDITGLIYDNPMPIEVVEGRKAYRAEHGDDAPVIGPYVQLEALQDQLGSLEVAFRQQAELLDIARDAQDQLRDELAAKGAEIERLTEQLKAMTEWREIAMRYAVALERIADEADNPMTIALLALQNRK